MEPADKARGGPPADEARRRWASRILSVIGMLIVAGLLGGIGLIGFAYLEQSDKVEVLERKNEKILADHGAIGATFGQQAKEFEAQAQKFAQQTKKLESAIGSSYRQGFVAGQRVRSVPAVLQPLSRYAAVGILVPRQLPRELDPQRMRIGAEVDGYVVRWGNLALFASRIEQPSVWTRQALAGVTRVVKIGSRRVKRLTGPSGVIYAWRENATTYAVVAFPRLEPAARSIIASMR